MADELSEGFIEPQIVPPLHGDEVTEPHMGDLVQEHVASPADVVGVVDSLRNELFGVGDRSRVLHRTVGEIWAEDTVQLVEWVQVVEEAFVKLETVLLELIDVVLLGLDECRQSF